MITKIGLDVEIIQDYNKYTLEIIGGTIKTRQSMDTGNIIYTRNRTKTNKPNKHKTTDKQHGPQRNSVTIATQCSREY